MHQSSKSGQYGTKNSFIALHVPEEKALVRMIELYGKLIFLKKGGQNYL